MRSQNKTQPRRIPLYKGVFRDDVRSWPFFDNSQHKKVLTFNRVNLSWGLDNKVVNLNQATTELNFFSQRFVVALSALVDITPS